MSDLTKEYPDVWEAFLNLGWQNINVEKEFHKWMQNMKVPYLNNRTPLEAILDGDKDKVIEGLDALASGAYL